MKYKICCFLYDITPRWTGAKTFWLNWLNGDQLVQFGLRDSRKGLL
jgi:hypothetical protein